jgi:general secretion pathway protein A
MYCSFYGFSERPFQLLPNPRFLYRSKKHEIALTYLEYGMTDRAGFMVITGEVGTGKTTLVKYMLQSLGGDRPLAFLSQTSLAPEQFLRALCQEFSLPHEGKGKTELIEVLGRFFVDQFSQGKHVLIVLDEAQNFPVETLEEIRMLSNLDADNESLLQILLVGQPELRRKLQCGNLLQLSQRVSVAYHLRPLDQDETEGYIRYRIQNAGGRDSDLFTPSAIDLIHAHSGGVPRIINSLCDMCLVYGLADELRQIDDRVVGSVLEDRAEWDLVRPVHDPESTQPKANPDEENGASRLLVSCFDRLAAGFESTNRLLAQIAANSGSNGNKEHLKNLANGIIALESRLKKTEHQLLDTTQKQKALIQALTNASRKTHFRAPSSQ